jgi:hypothetical protein
MSAYVFPSSIFSKQDHERLVSRINALTADTKPLWGTMTAAQMLAHCSMPLGIMLDEVKLQSSWLNLFIGKILRGRLLGASPFQKNSPTFKEAVITDERSFDTERAKVLRMLDRALNGGAAVITKDKHPFFGVMNVQEWDTLQSKHFDHHLRQFGV